MTNFQKRREKAGGGGAAEGPRDGPGKVPGHPWPRESPRESPGTSLGPGKALGHPWVLPGASPGRPWAFPRDGPGHPRALPETAPGGPPWALPGEARVRMARGGAREGHGASVRPSQGEPPPGASPGHPPLALQAVLQPLTQRSAWPTASLEAKALAKTSAEPRPEALSLVLDFALASVFRLGYRSCLRPSSSVVPKRSLRCSLWRSSRPWV